MKLFTLAWRNVWRNRQRSLVTISAMMLACLIMIFFAALMEGMIKGSERNVVAMNMGDIQIHAPGYRDDPDLYLRINDDQQLVQRLNSAGFMATPRLYGFGLLAANAASSGVQLRGIDLIHEAKVTELNQHVAKGQWLAEGRAQDVVLGKKLAGTLGVSIGDELVFVGQSADGYMANDLFYVRGVLKSVSDGIDRMGMFMPIDSLRSLLAIPEGAHEIVVMRADQTMPLDIAVANVSAMADGLEVKHWKSLMPVVARMIETADVQIMIMLVIFYIAVATVVLNAMLMNVFERIHEFGVMRALGVSPWQLVALIYCETVIQAVVAAALGLLGGWWIADYYAVNGLDMSGLAGSISYGGIAFDPIWYAYITPASLAYPVIFLIVVAMLAVIYPATKAAIIRPVEAIHHL